MLVLFAAVSEAEDDGSDEEEEGDDGDDDWGDDLRVGNGGLPHWRKYYRVDNHTSGGGFNNILICVGEGRDRGWKWMK